MRAPGESHAGTPEPWTALCLRATLIAAMVVAPRMTAAAGAHVHGEAVLEVSIGVRDLLVTLRGPAQVFYGFERAPSTAEEAAVVREAVALLRDPDEGILTVDGSCSVEQVTLGAPFDRQAQDWVDAGAGASHDHQLPATQDHEDAAAHAHPDEPGGHVDLEVTYAYRCTETPSRLTIEAFAAFPALEYVEAAWISATAAGGERLSEQSPDLQFASR